MPSRRTDGEGTPERTSTGKWRYRGVVQGKRVSGRSFTSKKEAYDDFKRAVKEKKENKPAPLLDPAAVPLADYCNDVLATRYQQRVKEGKLAPRTWELYASIVANHLDGDPLGESLLRDIDEGEVEAWWRRLPMSDASRLRYLVFLSGVFEVARKEKAIPSNPVRDAEKPKAPIASEFRIYSLEESEDVLARLRAWEARQDARWRDERKATRPAHERGRLVLAALLGLHGFGPSEMCGLSKADLIDGGLFPKRQGQRGKIVNRLKTPKRRAWVPLDDELLEIVEALPDGLLLAADPERKKAVGDNNLRRSFKWALKGTPYADLTPYDLRHTFAMRLLEENTDVQTAAELMRHTTEVFLRRYVRSRESLKRAAVKRARGGKKDKPTQGTNPREGKAA